MKTIEDWNDQLDVFRRTMKLNVLDLKPLKIEDHSSRASIAKQRSEGTLPLMSDISSIRFLRGSSMPEICVNGSDAWMNFKIFKKKFNPKRTRLSERTLRGISQEKKRGILELTKFMKPTRRQFWNSLPTFDIVDLQFEDDA